MDVHQFEPITKISVTDERRRYSTKIFGDYSLGAAVVAPFRSRRRPTIVRSNTPPHQGKTITILRYALSHLLMHSPLFKDIQITLFVPYRLYDVRGGDRIGLFRGKLFVLGVICCIFPQDKTDRNVSISVITKNIYICICYRSLPIFLMFWVPTGGLIGVADEILPEINIGQVGRQLRLKTH